MKTHISESGFSIIESLLVVVALGLIGFAGNYVYQTNKTVDTLNSKTDLTSTSATGINATITPVTTATITPVTTATIAPDTTATIAPITVPVVKTSSDLDTAQTTLDQNDPTTTNNDSTELDAELASVTD